MSQRVDASDDRQCLWTDLEIRAQGVQPTDQGLWLSLKERLDYTKQKPKAVSTVEVGRQILRGEEYFILKNTKRDTYLQIDERGFFLWSLMDGKHTLTDITLAYLQKYNASPFHHMNGLMASLKDCSLLEEKTPDLYELLLNKLGSQTLQHKLVYLWGKLSKGELNIDSDSYFSLIYNNGGWLLFTHPALALWAILSTSGSVLFLMELFNPRYSLSNLGRSGGVLSIVLLNLVLLIIHEHGHGLTVKHFGRKVIKGGFLIYYGNPSFFVDTTDMWLGTRNQRIAVSWAGPFTTILIASICSIAIAVVPPLEFGHWLFGISILGMLSALMNLSPLLEWDGYYMLMNYLEIPGLRAKSFDFMRKQLWQKLLSGKIEFSQEEKIFAVFGAVAGAWSIIAILLIPTLWENEIYPAFESIWDTQGIAIKIILLVIGLLLILSVVSSVATMIWGEAQHIMDSIKHLRDQ